MISISKKGALRDYVCEQRVCEHLSAMNLREEFLKSVEEDSPETFLRFIEQHVSKVHSYLEDRLLNGTYQLVYIRAVVLISKDHSIGSLCLMAVLY